jgi:ComEC/Rec2-related protein
MGFLQTIPFAGIFLPFCLGLVFNYFFPETEFRWSLTLVSTGLFFLFFLLFFFLGPGNGQSAFGICFFLVILSAGWGRAAYSDRISKIEESQFVSGKPIAAELEIVKELRRSASGIPKYIARVLKRLEGKKVFYHDSEIILSGTPEHNLGPGIRIIALIKPAKISSFIPFQDFSPAAYWSRKGIYFQARLESGRWMHRKTIEGTGFMAGLHRLRDLIYSGLEEKLSSESSKSLIRALVFGDTGRIDRETLQVYSFTGALHVLAVSGLHVGLVFYFFSLGFIKRRVFLGIDVLYFRIGGLLVVWFFVFLTGLSPSTLRAAIMISIWVIGKSISRSGNTANSLFFAGFIILLVNPEDLFQPGFQFSFLAVIGILVSEKFSDSFPFSENKILNWIRSLAIVSLFAQLFTCPLALFYSGVFPVSFLISNFICIPLGTLILYFSLGGLIISGLGFSTTLFARILEFLSYLMSEGLRLINEIIPGMAGMKIDFITLLFCYLLLALMILSPISRPIRLALVFALIQLYGISIFLPEKGKNDEYMYFYSRSPDFVVQRKSKATIFSLHQEMEAIQRKNSKDFWKSRLHLKPENAVLINLPMKQGYALEIDQGKWAAWIACEKGKKYFRFYRPYSRLKISEITVPFP